MVDAAQRCNLIRRSADLVWAIERKLAKRQRRQRPVAHPNFGYLAGIPYVRAIPHGAPYLSTEGA